MTWKKGVQVNIINYLDKINSLEELMPKEFAVVGKWQEQGILEHQMWKRTEPEHSLFLKMWKKQKD